MVRLLYIFLLLIPISAFSNPYPISILNGLLVSKATIEGKEVLIIFDTGAPGLVLNSRFYTAENQSTIECSTVNGSFQCRQQKIRDWSWMGIKHRKTNALVADLSFLENMLHADIHALVGLSALEDYYVSIDFDHQSISLEEHMSIDKNEMIRFQYADHIPVIKCKVNGKNKILGIDTGAEVNYLFDQNDLRISSAGKLPVCIIGAENKKTIRYQHTIVLSLKGKDECPSDFVIEADTNTHPAFDGLLGQPFLSQYNITIHPGKQFIIFSPRTSAIPEENSLTAQL